MARDLLFEIGCEELPPMQVRGAVEDLANAFAERAAALRLSHGPIERFFSPRRLALRVSQMAERQEDLETTKVGPPAAAAYGADGALTPAALGFLRNLGLGPEAVFTVTQERKKGKAADYIAAQVREEGRPTMDLLGDLLSALPAAIRWGKPMRWAYNPVVFARPVHWLLARFGEEVVACSFAGIASGGSSSGHRFHAPDLFAVATPASYVEALRQQRVLVDPDERRQQILELARQAAREVGGRLREDEGLLDELIHLVEWPVPIVGRFDDDFLALPAEVLVTSMRKHQRYFSVVDADGKTSPFFVAIANTEVRDRGLVARGNARVLRARLQDAAFFFREDRRRPLAQWSKGLERVTYVEGLGSVADKVGRLVGLSEVVAGLWSTPVDRDTVLGAAALCKADLVTGMVGEFPELQGVMGATYAAEEGATPALCQAIREHYAPRQSGEAVAESAAGAVLAVVDKLDAMASLFALNRVPTGAADPFALRRAAVGLLRTLLAHEQRWALGAAIASAVAAVLEHRVADGLPGATEVEQRLRVFIEARLRFFLAETHPVEVVDAVTAVGDALADLPGVLGRVQALSELRKSADFEPFAATFKRVSNILSGSTCAGACVDAALFEVVEEVNLHAALQEVEGEVAGLMQGHHFGQALQRLVALRSQVDLFFDAVLVNCDDAARRENRHALLAAIQNLFNAFADVRRL